MVRAVFWEQKVFLLINTPLRFVSLAVKFVLEPIYRVMKFLWLPLLLLLMAMNLIWLLLVGVIMFFSKISRTMPMLRPVSFVLALPFLLVADFLVTISPIPTPNDVESVMCRRAFKTDQLCALNFDQGLLAACHRLTCG